MERPFHMGGRGSAGNTGPVLVSSPSHAEILARSSNKDDSSLGGIEGAGGAVLASPSQLPPS